MELALITQFTWTDGFSLISSVLGTILYGIIVYALLFKKKPQVQEKIVLVTAITFFLYFIGNFFALFARALAEDLFKSTYIIGWILNLIGLSFMPASLLHSFFVYKDYKNRSINNINIINPLTYGLLHLLSFYFLYQFTWNIDNKTILPWPVLTSNITPLQFKLFSWWLGLCTAISGIISFSLKGNPRWKRFDNYFPINGIFLFLASILTISLLSSHPWTIEIAPIVRFLFLIMAFIPGATLGYYLVRYQFLNVLIKPTILYSVLTAIIIIVYQFGIRNIAHYLSNYDMINVRMVEIILMVILVFLFHPIRIYLHRKMNQLFFQDTEKYKSTIHKVSQNLKKITNYKQIERLLLDRLESSLHIKKIKVFQNIDKIESEILKNKSDIIINKEFASEIIFEWMENYDFDLVGQIKDSDGILGIIGLKLKPYKVGFNPNEMHLLNTILNQLALTFRNLKLVENHINLEKAILRQEKLSTLGQISTSISHEVKNPLHSIYTLVQVMEEEEPKGKELKRDLSIIRTEIKDLSEILNEILKYANPKTQTEYVPININQIINKTIRLLSKEAQNSKINIDYKPSHEIIFISIPGKLKEIIFNLTLNGIQACKDKGKLIKITVTEINDLIKIIITDDGPGIDNNIDLFEPFYTTKDDGTGLGLTIVKSKVEELGGTIKVYNGELGGAEFIILLPKEIYS
ncbi:MAG: hypothetical protein CMF96_09905 [Candidatus Marinimicrobia bacterium]|nr:hypothetical protein [Candidatus Neomarinimicrobiota bacterium]